MIRTLGCGIVFVILVAYAPDRVPVGATGRTALAGTVNSRQEGKMEGVLVTARREAANVDVTVVSDRSGRYEFPEDHLAPGKYTLKIRAVGYDLVSPASVDVTNGKTATLDLTLDETKDLSSQINSVEWLMSLPGTDEQKALVHKQTVSCTYCHSLERIVKSRHTAEAFVKVINRMQSYYPDGTMAGTEGRGRARMEGKEVQAAAEKNPLWGYSPGANKQELSAYLASINMSGGRRLPAAFKTLPRPKGKATRVIITQYDMPRKDTVPHDSDVDWNGNVWYTDQSDYYVGMLDAKTGTIKEWPLPKASTHHFGGASDVTIDRKNRPWFSVTVDKIASNFGVPGRFDRQTGQWTPVAIERPRFSQFNALAPDGAIVQGNLKIDAETMQLLDEFEWEKAPNPPPGGPFQGRDAHVGYEPAMDSKGNWYLTDFAGGYIIQVDAKTKKVNWFKTPTPASQPRRGRVDNQDRFWFAEYTADKLAMLDTKTSKITEWDTGIKWSGPYTSSIPDGKGRVYTPSSASDRVFQLDPKTGEVMAFLMPTRDFDTKQMSVDPVSKNVIWLANVRNARIIRIEPLD